MKKMRYLLMAIPVAALLMGAAASISADEANNVIDEVAWVIGDEPIYRSDIEEQYQQMQQERTPIAGNPYCVIPEQLAVEKLYLHQAKIDTVEPSESQVQQAVDKRLNFFIANLGSKEKVEEMFRKPMNQLREQLVEIMRNNYITMQVQENLTKNVKATPNDVRKYFTALPADSVPYVPMQVEVQVITLNPIIPREEIEEVKGKLRDITERINNGSLSFSTAAIMYSEDGSKMQGGELGFHNKSDFVPEFSNVAFNLNDPKKVSKIVETEYGFHIIQLIEKRGDQVNVRHILMRPQVSKASVEDARFRLDSLRTDLLAGKFTFDEAAKYVSQDKDTRNNRGIMMNPETGSTRFEMQHLPSEVARRISSMKPGDISEAFVMMDEKSNKEVVSIVRLTDRIEGHRANLSDDYNMLKGMYEDHEKQRIIKDWVEKKIKETPVQIEEGWRDCDFQYEGWIK